MMRCLTHPLFLYLAVWAVAGAAYLAGMLAGVFPDPEPITVGAVLLNLLTFALGYLTWRLFVARRSSLVARYARKTSEACPERSRGAPRATRAALKLTALCGVLALALGLYRVAVVAAHSDSSFFALLANPGLLRLRLVMYIEASLGRISYIPMLISLTSSLFAIGFVLLGVFLYVDRTKSKYLYLAGFLVVGLAIGLTNLSRYEVTVNVLYLIFAYAVMSVSDSEVCPVGFAPPRPSADAVGGVNPTLHDPQTPGRRAGRDILLPLATVAVLFVAIDLLLGKSSAYAQPDRLRGALFSLYWYLASPLAAFNDFLSTFDGHYHLGEYTLFPFYKWLHRLDLVAAPQISFYGEMTYLPFMTNVYTYLRNLYEDFGLIGVAVVPYLLGWATCAVRPLAARRFAFLNLCVVLLVLLSFSFYNYFLMSSQVYLQVALAFLFFRFDLPTRPSLA